MLKVAAPSAVAGGLSTVAGATALFAGPVGWAGYAVAGVFWGGMVAAGVGGVEEFRLQWNYDSATANAWEAFQNMTLEDEALGNETRKLVEEAEVVEQRWRKRFERSDFGDRLVLAAREAAWMQHSEEPEDKTVWNTLYKWFSKAWQFGKNGLYDTLELTTVAQQIRTFYSTYKLGLHSIVEIEDRLLYCRRWQRF
eukprot:TRINITY_DN10629_c0_g4_i1.p1 TRINITY_DN10629_c0_g4~~TRINITY_DN10629_c0_g4_i1.p1  ORF type:complete len:196 (-),score=36.31 TRINITY_DN10629_c0_g4_i1:29-616(-)